MISRPLSLHCRHLVQHVLQPKSIPRDIRERVVRGDVRIAKGRIHVVVVSGGVIIYRVLYQQISR